MTPIRVITVDDELLALRRLRLLLQTIPEAEHVGEASSCAEAHAKISELNPDAVLLDIKLRDGSGFEVVEAIVERANPPLVIFVTAFDQFAPRAFDNAVVDYLLKPVERDRLALALERVRQQLQAKDAEQRVQELQQVLHQLRTASNGTTGQAFETEFWLRGTGGLIRVPVDTIDCVSSADEYVAIHTATGQHLMRGSIRQFVQRVEPGLFVRVHRRWLVRRSAIARLLPRPIGQTEVILRNGRRLPAGRVYLKQLRQSIRNEIH